MTRNDDELDGIENLSDRQRWAVSRYNARAGRYHRDRMNDDPWAKFDTVEAEDEARDVWRGGNR